MRLFKFIFMLLLTVGCTVLFSSSFKIGKASLPPLGKLLSPFTGFWQNGESKELNYAETIEFSELSQAVKVLYDDRMIPHIFAESVRDAVFAQGYVTAQHRLWQMEFQTHAAAGRLSEIIGERGLKIDKAARRKGMVWAAEKELEHWKQLPEYQYIEAYSEGVNAYISSLSSTDYPLEYKLLNYAPETWTTFKCALLQKEMSRTLASHEYDVENTLTREWLGEAEFDFLFPENNPKQSPIIPTSRKWDFAPKPVTKTSQTIPKIGQLKHDLYEKPYEGIGSNNWAVSGKKTSSGYPILCSDPHLRLSVPSIWYEIQLHAPGFNVYGVSLPGSPGVIIGFNEHIAWGMTNVGHDVSDWYIVDWKDDSRKEYLYNGTYRKTTFKVEKYQVKNGTTVKDTVLYTHFGPVAYSGKSGEDDLALRWMAHEAGNDMSAFFKLNQAKNYDEYQAAIADYGCPAQNFVFADRKDVAIWVQGKFPLKNEEQGRFLQVGNSDATQWQGYIPREHNPHVFNPPRGYVSSANQHSTAEDYPYYYCGSFGDYRGRYINQILDDAEQVSIDNMMDLQNDSYGLHAAECLPLMLQYLDRSTLAEDELEELQQLKNWDYVYHKDQVAPTIFSIWYDEFYSRTWDEFYAVKDSIDIVFPEMWRTIQLLEKDPENRYFDVQNTTLKETANEVINTAFRVACKKIRAWKSKHNQAPTWSDYRDTDIEHLARIPAFSLREIEADGHRYSPNALSERHGPSWRMVVEMGDPIRAYGVYPGGQSGNPGSPYFDDFTEKWMNGEYYPLLFMKEADKEHERVIFSQNFK